MSDLQEYYSGPIEVGNEAELAIAAFAEYHKETIEQIKQNGGEQKLNTGLFISLLIIEA
jgi:hypothetical protein